MHADKRRFYISHVKNFRISQAISIYQNTIRVHLRESASKNEGELYEKIRCGRFGRDFD